MDATAAYADFDVMFDAPYTNGDYIMVGERRGNTYFDLIPLDINGDLIPGSDTLQFDATYSLNTCYAPQSGSNPEPWWLSVAYVSLFNVDTAVTPIYGFRVDNEGNADSKFLGLSDEPFGSTPSSISGTVFEDVDNNGTQDAGESGIANATVTLTGTDDGGNTINVSTQTDVDGNYTFAGLSSGTYTITETTPAGYLDGIDTVGSAGGTISANDEISGIVLGEGVDEIDYDFGEIPLVSISGTVEADTDENGSGDTPLANVQIELLDDNGATVATTTTDANGDYEFTDVPPGDYTIIETDPTGYGSLSDVDDGDPNSIAVTVTDSDVTGRDFVDEPYSTSIELVKSFDSLTDTTGDGQIGAGDTIGYTFEVTNTGNVDLTDVTISDAKLALTDAPCVASLSPGETATCAGSFSYVLTSADITAGGVENSATATGQPPASTGLAAPIDTSDTGTEPTAGSSPVTIDDPGATETENPLDENPNDPNDPGEDPTTVLLGVGSVAGSVYEDDSNDGLFDPAESGIDGVTLTLTGTDVYGNAVSLTTTTAADGSYSFDGVTPGVYTVTETQPTGYADGIDTVGSIGGTEDVNDEFSDLVVEPGTAATGYNFGELVPASISGTVVEEGDAPVAGVTLTLTGTDQFGDPIAPVTTVTDANGDYSFGDLSPGTYTVTETQPVQFGSADPGQTSPDTDADTSTENVISNLVLEPGDDSPDNDFFEERGSLAGHVFLDVNDDGVFTDGVDLGLDGETVTLSGSDALGNPVDVTAITGADGFYEFTDLLAGDYVLTETQPAQVADGSDTAGNVDGVTLGTAADDVITDIALEGGADGVAYDFGERPPYSVSGNVSARNDAGTLDPIAGVTVTLTGDDVNGNPVNLTTSTDAFGDYRFGDLLPGVYTVTEAQPAGFADDSTSGGPLGTPDDSVENTISSIDVADDLDVPEYADNDFVEAYGSIAGTVFEDLNNDGVQDAGEPGIAGASVTLNGTDPNGAIVPVTIVTDANGDYLFVDLLAGTYSVDEVTPAGFVDGTDADGDTGGAATNPGDQISGITLDAGEDAAEHDFGEIRSGSISGSVLDEYGDPIVGVTLTLTGTDDLGAVSAIEVTTDAAGGYVFGDLRPGTYTVTETQPAGFGEGDVSSDDPGATTGDTVISGLTVGQGESNDNNDFVETYSSIAGHVFVDVDDDGTYTLGVDLPLAGETVTLDGTDPNGDVGPLTVTTNADGEWVFDDLLAGTYTVTETQPAGLPDGQDSVGSEGGTLGDDVVADIPLPAGVDAVDYDFGETPAASIAGNVSDENGAPLEGVTITLTGVDSFGSPITPVLVLTDENGDYLFEDLAPGTYTVTETQPEGYGDVSTTAGSADGDDTTENTVSGIEISLTTIATDYDFVEGYSSIAGTVYEDLNDNGVQDSGEPGISGVDVTLTGTDPNGDIAAITVQTDADGDYLFDDLLAGSYTVTEPTQPSGLLDGADVAGSVGGTAVNPGDEINSIELPVVTDAVDYDFGEIRPATISGNVSDENGAPIPGVEVTLTGTDDLGNEITPVVVVTDAEGNYEMPGLRPGTYTVTETQPAGYGDGSEESPTGDTSGVNVIATIAVDAGGVYPNNDFIETFSSIAGVVYVDVNENGVRDEGEPALAGVTVRLNGTDPNGAITELVAETADDGSYLFDDLLAGTYAVTEETPSAFNDGDDVAGSVGGSATNPGDAITDIVLPPATDAVNYDFGEIGTTVSGTVFLDDDRDGSIGSDEELRLEGVVMVLLDDAGTEVARTTTASDGTYLFVGLSAGDYTVAQEQPDGYGTTTVNELDISVPNAGLTEVDFGEDLGSVGNFVFRDTDEDGVQDDGEPGIAGVTVRLLDADGNVIEETVTDQDGAYLFDRLAPGDYLVEFVPGDGDSLTVPGEGDAGSGSDPDWVTNRTEAVTLDVDSATGLVDRRDDIDAGVVPTVIDLGITATIDRTTASVGDQITFGFNPVNDSDVPVADGARVVLEIPSSVDIDEVVAPGWVVTVEGNRVVLVLDETLMPNEPLPPIAVLGTVINATGTTMAQATISTINGDTETTQVNNLDDVGFTVAGSSILAFTGANLATNLLFALGLIVMGSTLVAATRRRARA